MKFISIFVFAFVAILLTQVFAQESETGFICNMKEDIEVKCPHCFNFFHEWQVMLFSDTVICPWCGSFLFLPKKNSKRNPTPQLPPALSSLEDDTTACFPWDALMPHWLPPDEFEDHRPVACSGLQGFALA
jgi:hypothetical protein